MFSSSIKQKNKSKQNLHKPWWLVLTHWWTLVERECTMDGNDDVIRCSTYSALLHIRLIVTKQNRRNLQNKNVLAPNIHRNFLHTSLKFIRTTWRHQTSELCLRGGRSHIFWLWLLFQNFSIRVQIFFEFENPTPVQTPATIDATEIHQCLNLSNDIYK